MTSLQHPRPPNAGKPCPKRNFFSRPLTMHNAMAFDEPPQPKSIPESTLVPLTPGAQTMLTALRLLKETSVSGDFENAVATLLGEDYKQVANTVDFINSLRSTIERQRRLIEETGRRNGVPSGVPSGGTIRVPNDRIMATTPPMKAEKPQPEGRARKLAGWLESFWLK